MRTLPLAPDDDVTVHIVLNDFGPLGQAYVETDEAKADEATIIENILSGRIRTRYEWSRSTPPRVGRVI